MRIFFENGKSFVLIERWTKFLEYFQHKRNQIMLTVLIRIPDSSISRVKIWTDRTISFQDIKYVMFFFTIWL